MKIASIFSVIFNLALVIQAQCAGCATGTNPCAPCCATGSCGGPPPPPGFPIDNYIYLLFFAAIFLGAYVVNKRLKQA